MKTKKPGVVRGSSIRLVTERPSSSFDDTLWEGIAGVGPPWKGGVSVMHLGTANVTEASSAHPANPAPCGPRSGAWALLKVDHAELRPAGIRGDLGDRGLVDVAAG